MKIRLSYIAVPILLILGGIIMAIDKNKISVDVSNISVIYATCVLNGTKQFDTVLARFKSDTAVILVSIGAEELVTDEAYLAEAKERLAAAEDNQE